MAFWVKQSIKPTILSKLCLDLIFDALNIITLIQIPILENYTENIRGIWLFFTNN